MKILVPVRFLLAVLVVLTSVLSSCSVFDRNTLSDNPAIASQQQYIKQLEQEVEEAERRAEEAEEREKAAKNRLKAAKHELKALEAEAKQRNN